MIHEDNRRIMASYPEAKLITAKEDCIVGGHYHIEATETFILISGHCELSINKKKVRMKKSVEYKAFPCDWHELKMKAGTVLAVFDNVPYNPKDTYTIYSHL